MTAPIVRPGVPWWALMDPPTSLKVFHRSLPAALLPHEPLGHSGLPPEAAPYQPGFGAAQPHRLHPGKPPARKPVHEPCSGKRATGANAAVISLRIITHRAPTMLFIEPKQAAIQTEPHGSGAGRRARGPSLAQTGRKTETGNLFHSVLGWTGASPLPTRWLSSH